MRKTLLIARREYLAFVRTVGFWLSIVTAPLIFTLIIAVPMLIRTSAPVEVMNVAILDLTGADVEKPLRRLIERVAAPQEAQGRDAALQNAANAAFDKERIKLVPLPQGLDRSMTVAAAETRIPALLATPDAQATTIVVVSDDGDKLHFRIWSQPDQRKHLEDKLYWDLHGLQYMKVAGRNGIDPKVAEDMRAARAEIVSLTPADGAPGEEEDFLAAGLRDHGPRVVGIALGFLTWFTIFSSSMILLGGVIEEKASKVLEVLLASASTESLLIGKVLGVAAVLSTVGLIWGTAIFALVSQGASFMPPDIAQTLQHGLAGIFTPAYVVLLLTYFVGGYLMFGVTFAAIGAFCETQKDAQAIMGPLMIVLMVPMLCMQAAIGAPSAPIIQWLSWVPIFTPFLMPLRLSEPLPAWEIALTLGGMLAAAFIMIAIGRRAFKQGALTGGKLTWGAIARIATRKSNDA
ncbi:hypothetical protein ABAC460_15880 [Asticcacaulis sp. AC460]|uniref:ABC transporter permease n=1 Tax=Asticcacaulis sp. AC460 TaxID=1282360 RepID=UPI0003C3F40F|nr:ABC transporter permease [Asticcacaulis sp. AC460]ESQ88138.1 hypothetical protein ABAC460_15880 [Asticcacaulis sp. AC460]